MARSNLEEMSLEVTVHEAKALSNVSGRIKCRVELKQGSRRGMPENSISVEEDTSPVFRGADFSLESRDFDVDMASLIIYIISGGDTIGTADIPLSKICDGNDDYVRKL